MIQLYDAIGVGYGNYRRPNPRLAAAIRHALGDATSVVNVGTGAGSYEPTDRPVVAVEPSLSMIRQRPGGRAPHLPFRDATLAAALAVLTVHHWPDRARGLTELARVARRRLVIVTWDPETSGFWLVDDYFPAMVEIDRRLFPSPGELRTLLGAIEIHPLLIPHDDDVEAGLARLRGDLEDGTWERRHGHLLRQSELDLGYRLVIARRAGEAEP